MIENEALAEPAEPTAEPVVAETDAAVVESEETAEPEAAEPAEPAEGRAKIVLKRAGAETEDVFEFGSPAIVGRFDPSVGPIDVDLGTLDEGVYVSRKHAKFVFEDGAWRIEDLGSSNGTFVLRSDFEKVDSAELQDGDEISFGNARFVFHLA